jgi:lysophospholipase L1-like esterase
MKIQYSFIIIFLISTLAISSYAQDVAPVKISKSAQTLTTQWNGKRVAFLGDSMTDKCRVGTTCVYWEYLAQLLGIKPMVYGINGEQWDGIYGQAQKLKNEKDNQVDAIIILAGTNDYNGNIPIGSFYKETISQTNHNGKTVMRKHRETIISNTTFCGRINRVMSFLKQTYPTKQIILMTPIHRAYAEFGEGNVQPDESYCNGCNEYIDAYVDAIKQAASIWSVPIIDLYSLSGLYPLYDSNMIYFHDKAIDRLHPNALGDYRIARTIQYQLLALPSQFE